MFMFGFVCWWVWSGAKFFWVAEGCLYGVSYMFYFRDDAPRLKESRRVNRRDSRARPRPRVSPSR